ncbi:PilX N-terminal domain-containing pilus assembly protein [Candidatus Electrothrix sp.]|uniref:PilX N-terminal domain-containing pilus assembly protein n=1 Tax=Candidatus Electrothrix sp. TaxID=2170559 RepID=UPI004057A5D8
MKKREMYSRNDEGFVMVAALLILLVLTVMGIAVNRNTMTEWRIAMNDRQHKVAFYSADAVSELSAEILEQSIACLGLVDGELLAGYDGFNVYVEEGKGGFWRNYAEDTVPVPKDDNATGDDGRDLVFPAVVVGGTYSAELTNAQPHANIIMRGNTQLTKGTAIEMAAGYAGGAGKSLGSGGASLIYDINVYQVDRKRNTASAVCTKYLHSLGSEGTCNY